MLDPKMPLLSYLVAILMLRHNGAWHIPRRKKGINEVAIYAGCLFSATLDIKAMICLSTKINFAAIMTKNDVSDILQHF